MMVYTRGGEPAARGPHAARVTFSNGPPVYFATTARERMRTKHGLHPCYVTVAGDVALVLGYPSGFTLT